MLFAATSMGRDILSSGEPPAAARPRKIRRRARRQIAAILAIGGGIIAALWLTITVFIHSEYRSAMDHARREAGNLTGAVQQEVASKLRTVTGLMSVITTQMRADPNFNLYAWAQRYAPLTGSVMQGTVILAPDGRLLASSRLPHPQPLDLSDRAYFRVQRAGQSREPFIGQPIVGRFSGAPAVQISQRVEAADGRLLGVIDFSLSPRQLIVLSKTADLGPRGLLTLIGDDDVIRVRFGRDSENGVVGAGERVPPLPFALRDGQAPQYFVRKSVIDHVSRLHSVQKVQGYPLYVGVAFDLASVLQPAAADARLLITMGLVVTAMLAALIVLLVMEIRQRARRETILVREQDKLAAEIRHRNEVLQQLQSSEGRLRDFAEMASDWFWEQDAALCFTTIGEETPLLALGDRSHIGKRRWEVNDTSLAPEQWANHERDVMAHEPFRDFRYGRNCFDGKLRTASINGNPVFDAAGNFVGYRGTGRDITAEVEFEAELRKAKDRAEQAELLLRDAVDSMSEGFVIFDHEDRLITCNERYRQIYPEGAARSVPGIRFQDIIRHLLDTGEFPEARVNEEAWFARRMQHFRDGTTTLEQRCRDGSWILITDRRMKSGGTTGLRIDITALKQTQAALLESERRLRDFAETSSDWFWEQDAALRFTWVSLHDPVLGSDDSRYIGKRRDETIAHDPTDESWVRHQATLADRLPFRDFRYADCDRHGERRHISVSGNPVFDGDGNFLGYRGSGRDVIAQVEAEATLRAAMERAGQAEALLRDAIDSIQEGFVIYDRDDRLVMCNEPYLTNICGTAESLEPGTTFSDIVRASLGRQAYPDALGREEAWLRERLRQHNECAGGIELRLRSGQWQLATDRRMRNGGIAGLRVDITALKQAEERLRVSEARLDRAQEIAGIGSWELDVATGRYVWSKHMYRMRGLSPDHFDPTIDSVVPYIHPDDYPTVRRSLSELIAGHEADAWEIRIVRPDGGVRLFRVEGRAVIDADGAVCRVAGTMQDITESRLIHRQLAEAQKMEAIGALTGGMAHDFNNGLGIIIGNLDMLDRLVGTDQAAKELCDDAREGARRCAELVRQLLAFARRQPLHPTQTDVNLMVNDAARLLRRTLGEHVILRLNLGASLWPALTDPVQLEAALINLATNARDAMPKGGNLDIATRNVELDAAYVEHHPQASAGSYVVIEVTDNGTGISPEVANHIFEPFFTTKGPGQGSGLGLSMVFGFVRQSGGHVTVYSEPGRGSTFRMYLPRARAGDAKAVIPDHQRSVTGGDETVLVVEDNAPLRLVAVQQLTELGYRVLHAADAAAAWQFVTSEQRIDLLFTDVVMPGVMDGVELARQAVSRRSGLRVLLTSGFPGARATGPGSDAEFPLLGKPYRRDDLARAVRDALDRPGEHPAGAMVRRGAHGEALLEAGGAASVVVPS